MKILQKLLLVKEMITRLVVYSTIVKIYVILEEAKEPVLDFSQGTVKVL